YTLTVTGERYEVSDGSTRPHLRMMVAGGANIGFTCRRELTEDILYRVEESRGYQFEGALWSPGQFRLDVEPGETATLVLSTEPWDAVTAVHPRDALDRELTRRKRLVEKAVPAARSGFPA